MGRARRPEGAACSVRAIARTSETGWIRSRVLAHRARWRQSWGMSDTELLNAKINAGFDHLDADGDGHLSEQDHVLLGRRMSAELGHAPGSEQEQRVTESFLRIWREVPLPHVPEGATAISRAGFLDSVNALAADPDARAAVAAMAETYLS